MTPRSGSRLLRACLGAAWLFGASAALAAGAALSGLITNPVAARGADPWVVRHGDAYYYCQSVRGSIGVSQSARLQDLGKTRPTRVWTPPAGAAFSKELWAPELHWLRGRWYIYVAADDGRNENHRMFVLEGSSGDPQGPFTLKGQLAAPADRWAIDGTVLEFPDGRLFFVWSGWDGAENTAQNLYIAPMSNPWTLSGQRALLSRPEHDWERIGRPLVNEGPEALWHSNDLFIIYSASGSWGDDYCLGQLRWTGADPLLPGSWVKHPRPVFSKTARVFGPGHASFVLSRDGREHWMVYHSARRSGSGWDRQVNLQRFGWRADGSPDFGTPLPPGTGMPAPSGDTAASPGLLPSGAY